MDTLKTSTIIPIFDDEIGILWQPSTGTLKKTDSKVAKYYDSLLKDNAMNANAKELNEIYNHINQYFVNALPLTCINPEPMFGKDIIDRLELLVCNQCNLNCRYCYELGGTFGQQPSAMTPLQGTNYINALLSMGIIQINCIAFFGGEPLLCIDTIESICEYCHEQFKKKALIKIPDFTLITNGTLLDQSTCSILKKYNIRITISVDGPPEITNLLRIDKSGHGVYERIENGFHNMHKIGYPVRLIEATYTSMHESKGYTRNHTIEYLQSKFQVLDIFLSDCDSGSPDQSLVPSHISETVEINTYNRYQVLKCFSNHCYNSSSCSAGYQSFTILPNGDIYPCHYFIYKSQFKLATYKNGAYSWSNYAHVTKILESKNRNTRKQCISCPAKYGCNVCPATLILFDNDNLLQHCHSELDRQKEIILDYVKNSIE